MIDAKSLTTLISSGEKLDVEFKGEQHASLNDRDLVEAVVCLANRHGNASAWLLIGVEDAGRITGAHPPHGNDTDAGRLSALIAGRTRPPLACAVGVVEVSGHSVIVIEIPVQQQPVCTSDGMFLRRALGGDGRPACVPMDGYALQSLQSDLSLIHISEPTRLLSISYAVFCLKKKKTEQHRTRESESY